MAYDILKDYIPQIAQDIEQRQTIRKQSVDRITQMFNKQVPTPLEVATVADMTLRPLTRYEVARGVRRPTFLEAQTAARAATMKYDVDLLDIVDKGLDGMSRDAQVLVNAINAQASMGNPASKTISTVLKATSEGLSAPEKILYTHQYLEEVSKLGPDVPEAEYWRLGSSTLTKINPKGKIGLKKFTYPSEQGLTTTFVDDETGQVVHEEHAPRWKAGGSGSRRPLIRNYRDEIEPGVIEQGYTVIDEDDPTSFERVPTGRTENKRAETRKQDDSSRQQSLMEIEEAIGLLEDPTVAGLWGTARRAIEWGQGTIDAHASAPARKFGHLMERIKARNWKEILQDTRLSNEDAKRLDRIVSGKEWSSTPTDARETLTWLHSLMSSGSPTKGDLKPGHTEDGYEYLGGDAGDPNSWRRIK